MLECWKFLPGERPTFRYCLEVLEQLKTTTSSSIEITVATPNPRHSNGKERKGTGRNCLTSFCILSLY